MSTFVADERGVVFACPDCAQRNRLGYEGLKQQARCGNCHHELGPPSEPVEVFNKTVFDALAGRSALVVLVDFWAPWCGPCKMVAPELAKVAGESARRLLVAKVNTEDLPGLAQRFQIQAIPTMVLFSGGREIGRESGAMPAAAIRQFVHQAGV